MGAGAIRGVFPLAPLVLTAPPATALRVIQGGEDDLQKESAENAKSTIQCENRHMLTLMPWQRSDLF